MVLVEKFKFCAKKIYEYNLWAGKIFYELLTVLLNKLQFTRFSHFISVIFNLEFRPFDVPFKEIRNEYNMKLVL